MGAYNLFQGQYCCHNERLLNEILKTDWSFDGVVVSDWGGTEDTLQAAFYGLDIEMGTHTNGMTESKKSAYGHYYLADPFLEKIRNGEIPESIVNDKVRRIVRLMYRTAMDRDRPLGRMGCEDHSKIARQVAQEGIVLLKNTDHFFPLHVESGAVIAVIGENAIRPMTVGGGSSELKASYEISPLQGIRERFPHADIRYAMGYGSGKSIFGRVDPSPYKEAELLAEAVALAKEADVVLFVGGLNKNAEQDCEGTDRIDFGLPFGQEKLIKALARANANVGVLLITGNAVGMPWADDVDAIAQVWYLGSEAGHAIADVLSGDINPSGKLPFSIPMKLEDVGAHAFGPDTYPGDGKNVTYDEGIFVGYRWHQAKNTPPSIRLWLRAFLHYLPTGRTCKRSPPIHT